jgi:hypothetical protein
VKYGRFVIVLAICVAALLGWFAGMSTSTPASASSGYASTAAVAKAQATANAALAAAKRAQATANAGQNGGTKSARIVFVSPRACASPATADGQFTVAVSNNGAPFNTTLYNCLETVVVP